MTDDTCQDKATINGVPINDAPMPSNPDDPDKHQSQSDKPVSGTPVSTHDVTYDVPPADLER